MIEVKVTRNKLQGEWACQLIGPGGGVFLYQGPNGDTAHDVFDEIAPTVNATSQEQQDLAKVGYIRLKEEDPTWAVTLEIAGQSLVLLRFGKGGANKAADFAETVTKALQPA